MQIAQEEGTIIGHAPDRARRGSRAARPHPHAVANMVEGVTNGFEKKLEIQGVGYRAALAGDRTSSSRSATRTR